MSGWGGAREGAGAKPAGYVPPAEKLELDAARARHELVKLEEREFKLAIQRGQYLPREAQRQAGATLLAVLSQSLRSVPDTLERVCGLTPEQAALAQQMVDEALAEVANTLKAMVVDE